MVVVREAWLPIYLGSVFLRAYQTPEPEEKPLLQDRDAAAASPPTNRNLGKVAP